MFSLVYLCLFGLHGFGVPTLVCSVLPAVCYVTELITSLEALKTAPLVPCNPCAMGGGIILTSIAGMLFFAEPMSLLQWLGVAVFFTAAYCLSPAQQGRGESSSRRMTGRAWLLLAANFLINGAASILSKYFAVRAEGGNAALYSCITCACSSLLFLLLAAAARRSKADRGGTQPPLPKPLLVYGTLLGATCSSIVCLTTTLSRTVTVVGLNTVPSVISVVGCLFLGAVLFREKITGRNVCGVVLGALSVAMIVYG